MDLRRRYHQRSQEFVAAKDLLVKQSKRYAIIRLFAFVLGVAAIILLCVYYWPLGILSIILFLLVFSSFISKHRAVDFNAKLNERLAELNLQEIRLLDYDFAQQYDGSSFIDLEHPYSGDLDLFGPHSFFQYTNRCKTHQGNKHLAQYLNTLEDTEEILLRQEAIQSLAKNLDWMQLLQAQSAYTEDESNHLPFLKEWFKMEDCLYGKSWVKFALWLMPIFTPIAAFYTFMTWPWYFAIISLVPAHFLLRKYLEPINKLHQYTGKVTEVLQHYSKLMSHIEQGIFEAEKCRGLQSKLKAAYPASAAIKRLSYLSHQLDARINFFAIILNIFGLWDMQWTYRLETWKAQNKSKLQGWFDALGEMEALVSLSSTYYSNPHWVFPKIKSDPNITATALGHPLISPKECVSNDLDMPSKGHIKLITGSNMAGKSTFLRTVGINIVLARIGSPVCATSMELPLLDVFTSMRTQDALHENTSSFYAELKRLKLLIDLSKQDEDVYFILDEILKGTNSNDRHKGARALINQLLKAKSAGLIATHDLELGLMEADANGQIENLCMEVKVKDDELVFDYKIEPGVSKSFNATQLMRRMGIDV